MTSDHAQNKTHLVLVNAVVFKNDHVLISKRSPEEIHEPNKWTIPGGKVERTTEETFNVLEETAKREVMEETGVIVDDSMELITNNTFIRSTGQHTIALVFACTYKQGEAKPLEDTSECRWIIANEINQYDFAPNVKRYIKEAFSRRNILKL